MSQHSRMSKQMSQHSRMSKQMSKKSLSFSFHKMSSKRKCGFLTTSVAKRLKLPQSIQHITNAFLLPPRKHYALIHQDHLAACYYGSQHTRPVRMRLIVAAIECIDWDCNDAENVDLVVESWVRAIKYGARISTCQKVLIRKDNVLSNLLFSQFDNGTWAGL